MKTNKKVWTKKLCKRCRKIKPIEDFEDGKYICKDCENG